MAADLIKGSIRAGIVGLMVGLGSCTAEYLVNIGFEKGYQAAQVRSVRTKGDSIILRQNDNITKTFVYNTADTNENLLGYGDMRTHIPLEEVRSNKIASLELKARNEAVALSNKYARLIEDAKCSQ